MWKIKSIGANVSSMDIMDKRLLSMDKKFNKNMDLMFSNHFDRVNDMFRSMSDLVNSQHDISTQYDNTQIINTMTKEDW